MLIDFSLNFFFSPLSWIYREKIKSIKRMWRKEKRFLRSVVSSVFFYKFKNGPSVTESHRQNNSTPPTMSPGASQVVLVVKNLSANAQDRRDAGSSPGSGRFLGGGHNNPLTPVFLFGESQGQRSLVGYMVHRVAKSWAPLSNLAWEDVPHVLIPEDMNMSPYLVKGTLQVRPS